MLSREKIIGLMLFLFSVLFAYAADYPADSLVSKLAVTHSQTRAGRSYQMPAEFILFQESKHKDFGNLYYREKFYPIGWSKDGKCAYIRERATEAVDGYYVDLEIFDAAKDTLISVLSHEIIEPDTFPGNLKQAWSAYNREFNRKLDSFHIIQRVRWHPTESDSLMDGHYYLNRYGCLNSEDMERKLSFKLYDSKYDIVKSDYKMKTDSSFSETFVDLYTISLKKNDVRTRGWTEKMEQYSGIMNVELLHVFIDPTENWGIIIYRQLERGWEGPPHINQFKMVGFEL